MLFFDVFHFLYNTKTYRFRNGQNSAPFHQKSEHRRIGLIGWIVIIEIKSIKNFIRAWHLTHLYYYNSSNQSNPSMFRLLMKGCTNLHQNEIYTYWFYIKNEKHQKITFFSSYEKMLLVCHFHWSNNDLWWMGSS